MKNKLFDLFTDGVTNHIMYLWWDKYKFKFDDSNYDHALGNVTKLILIDIETWTEAIVHLKGKSTYIHRVVSNVILWWTEVWQVILNNWKKMLIDPITLDEIKLQIKNTELFIKWWDIYSYIEWIICGDTLLWLDYVKVNTNKNIKMMINPYTLEEIRFYIDGTGSYISDKISYYELSWNKVLKVKLMDKREVCVYEKTLKPLMVKWTKDIITSISCKWILCGRIVSHIYIAWKSFLIYNDDLSPVYISWTKTIITDYFFSYKLSNIEIVVVYIGRKNTIVDINTLKKISKIKTVKNNEVVDEILRYEDYENGILAVYMNSDKNKLIKLKWSDLYAEYQI